MRAANTPWLATVHRRQSLTMFGSWNIPAAKSLRVTRKWASYSFLLVEQSSFTWQEWSVIPKMKWKSHFWNNPPRLLSQQAFTFRWNIRAAKNLRLTRKWAIYGFLLVEQSSFTWQEWSVTPKMKVTLLEHPTTLLNSTSFDISMEYPCRKEP